MDWCGVSVFNFRSTANGYNGDYHYKIKRLTFGQY